MTSVVFWEVPTILGPADRSNQPFIGASLPDEELARRATSGERACFEALLFRHRDRVYRVCFRSAGNAADAEDWAQECFVRAYQQLARYDASRPFMPWFYRLVANVCRNMARGRRRAQGHLESGEEIGCEAPDTSVRDPEADFLSREQQRRVVAAIGALPSPMREAVILRVLEGMTFADLAATFGVPLSTASTWVRRALVRVRRRLAQEGVEAGPW